MELRVLGPVEFVVDGTVLPTGHPRQRCVLAVLLVDANRTVVTEQLIDRVWGDQPPNRVRNVLSGYVARLRAVLGPAGEAVTLERRSKGYRLVVDGDRIDLHRFRRLTAQAQSADAGRAEATLTEALALWRGPAFADTDCPWLANLRHALQDERLTAELRRNDLALRGGRHAELLAGLHDLAEAHPLDERVTQQLMLALYRGGRQADALRAFTRARGRLADELGLDPGTELIALHRRILTNDPELTARPAPTVPEVAVPKVAVSEAAAPPVFPTPRQLPAAIGDFTGRGSELDALDAALATETDRPGPGRLLIAVEGCAGVGKTSLAVHWAHRVADRFPDGQLFVNLRGFAGGPPMPPIVALAQFLRALGVAPDRIPLDEGEAAAMYRSLLAGRRALVVLDDAHRVDQVRPLLPGSPGCAVLVTSRNQLRGLTVRDGGQRLTVDVLALDAARTLMASVLGERRVRAEPAAVDRLAELCAFLPLALRITAANLAGAPARGLADYAAELAAGNRLDALQVSNDQESAVRGALELSYAALDPVAQELFRRLGDFPGPDFTAEVAGVLLDAPADPALDVLVEAHLVEGGAGGRYRMHDLVRLLSGERAERQDPPAVREAALRRVLDHVFARVNSAADLLYPQMVRLSELAGPGADQSGSARLAPRHDPDWSFAAHGVALAWLDAERQNLVALVEHASQHGPHRPAWRLADALRGYFWLRRCAPEWLSAARAGLVAAESEDDVTAQASAWLSTADLNWSVGRYPEAVDGYRMASKLSLDGGWHAGQASTLCNLASVQVERGELRQASENYQASLAAHRAADRPVGLAVALSNLGNVEWEIGSLDRAAGYLHEALRLHEQLGSLGPEANALLNLGSIYHDLGRPDLALRYSTKAVGVVRTIGNRADEASALLTIAAVHCDAGRFPEARRQAHAALELAREIGGRRIEALALNTLGAIYRLLLDGEAAAQSHGQALELARTTGDRRGQTEALIGIAAVHIGLGHLDDARQSANQAIAHGRTAGYRLLIGYALTVLAASYRTGRDPVRAAAFSHRANRIYRWAGGRLGTARTYRVPGATPIRRGARLQRRSS
ncbi:AfsR/SARP family transcriptional regulator [Rugosimonospora africana]|uniref:SARP family transcriptional regulator n=1 Tax=Rugosimonospora africana TaxID=556532 RepID=A0A8J3VR41_9ACTN|nr:BTAD domain-containing putative transcriptional regulator [Rugosimonospora africana]GIH15702.1 SARP family transcriptional regulator [Rugosimonospora africana]